LIGRVVRSQHRSRLWPFIITSTGNLASTYLNQERWREIGKIDGNKKGVFLLYFLPRKSKYTDFTTKVGYATFSSLLYKKQKRHVAGVIMRSTHTIGLSINFSTLLGGNLRLDIVKFLFRESLRRSDLGFHMLGC